jgi:hypothetical protein
MKHTFGPKKWKIAMINIPSELTLVLDYVNRQGDFEEIKSFLAMYKPQSGSSSLSQNSNIKLEDAMKTFDQQFAETISPAVICNNSNNSEMVTKGRVVEAGAQSKPSSTSKTEPFRRVKAEDITIDKEELKNNSYHEFDTWGSKANKDIIATKGKSFRHEKTKKKKGSYRGGEINVGVNSIKFD